MIVCVCEGVSDREIRAAIQGGSRTVKDLGRACGAGGDCGRCGLMLKQMLRDAGCGGDCATRRPSSDQGCRAA